MSSPLENLAFHIVQHRTISTSSIYSLNDPWLGIDAQLLPLPEGLFRILIIAMPTFLLPHLLNQMRLMPGQEGADNLLFQLALFQRLYLQQKRLCDTVRLNTRRLKETKARQIQTLVKMRQRKAFFVMEDIEEMRNLWYKGHRKIAYPRGWKFLLFGRKHAAIEINMAFDDKSSQANEDDALKSVSSTSTSLLFQRIPRIRAAEDEQDEYLSTSSDVTISQTNLSMLQLEENNETHDDFNTPLQSPTTSYSQSLTEAPAFESAEVTALSLTEATDIEAERTLDLMYPLAL